MVTKIIVEILILWIWFAVYMAILVGRKGTVGAVFFYPKEVQQRVIELLGVRMAVLCALYRAGLFLQQIGVAAGVDRCQGQDVIHAMVSVHVVKNTRRVYFS